MDIVPLGKTKQKIWDEFVYHSEEAWVFHLSDWINLWQDIFKENDYSFMVTQNGLILAIVPLTLQKRACFRFLTSPLLGGVVLKGALDNDKIKEIMQLIMNYIDTLARKSNASFYQFNNFSIKMLNDNPSNTNNFDKFYGPKIHSEERSLRFIDLRRNEEVLWRNIKNNTRNDIKIAEKTRINIIETSDLNSLSIFYKMLRDTLKRTGAKVIPYSFYLALWHHFAQKGIVKILFAEYRKIKISAIFLICFKNLSFYLAGASQEQYLNLRPNHFIQWEAMLRLKESGYSRYLMGIFNPNTRKEKERKIDFFESRFGGEVQRFKYNLRIYSPLAFKAYKISSNLIRKLLPNR